MNVEPSTPEIARVRADIFRMTSGLFEAEPSEELLDKLALDVTREIIGMSPARCPNSRAKCRFEARVWPSA